MFINVLLAVLAVTIPPAPANRVADQAILLDSIGARNLGDYIARVEYEQDVRLGVLTLAQLDEDPKEVAVQTINAWRMSPRSILLLVSVNPRKIYIQPGDAFVTQLNRAVSEQISRDIIAPRLRAKDFEAAMSHGLSVSVRMLALGPIERPPPAGPTFDQVRTFPDEQTSADEPMNPALKWLLLFLVGAGLTAVAFKLIQRAKRPAPDQKSDRAHYQRIADTAASLPKVERTGGYTPPTGPSHPQPAYFNQPVAPVVVNNDNGFLTGMLVGQAMNHPAPTVIVPPPPPPPAPAPVRSTPRYDPPSYTPPSRSYDSDYGSSGGGGSSWDSGSSGGSDSSGGGGGGSDW